MRLWGLALALFLFVGTSYAFTNNESDIPDLSKLDATAWDGHDAIFLGDEYLILHEDYNYTDSDGLDHRVIVIYRALPVMPNSSRYSEEEFLELSKFAGAWFAVDFFEKDGKGVASWYVNTDSMGMVARWQLVKEFEDIPTQEFMDGLIKEKYDLEIGDGYVY